MATRTRRALAAVAVLLTIPMSAAPSSAATSSTSTAAVANEPVTAADSPPYGTLDCGYNVGHGGSGRWYRNCTGTEKNVGGIPFQGLWCVPAHSYRELSAWTFAVQIVSNDCSNPPTDK